MTNLPAVPGQTPFKDRPGAVQVVTRSEVPSIVSRMRRVNLSDETIEAELDRYNGHAKLQILNPNEKAAAASYEALADGRVLIDIGKTLNDSRVRGVTGRMQLAIAHPSMRRVVMRRWHTENEADTVFDFAFRTPHLERPLPFQSGKRILHHTFYTVTTEQSGGRGARYKTYEAITPAIPAEVRLQHPNLTKDKRYLLLWEAEWSFLDEHEPHPPIFDPALLYQVSGSLYSVVAVWDLTPVEAAALRPGPKL